MTLAIPFDPRDRLLRRLATADPADLPDIQRAACELLRLPVPEPDRDLTQREKDALHALGWRKPRTTTAVSVDLVVSYRWSHELLKRLESKGYVMRIGSHPTRWVRVDERPALELVPAAA